MRESDVIARFGATIRRLRFRLGISQEELAGRADLHRTYIAGIEGGARNVTLKSIDKLATALNVSMSTLLRHVGETGKTGRDQKPELVAGEFVEILLVEDNPDDVEMTLRAFGKARFTNRVHVVRDGAEALDFVFGRRRHSSRKADQQPKVILLDLNLPKVNGLEVLRRIKGDKNTRHIPVIVLTESQMYRDMLECKALGAETYIVKPVDFHRLSEATLCLDLDWALVKPTTAKQ